MPGIFSPNITDGQKQAKQFNGKKPLYDLEIASLGELIYALTNYQFSFEQIREMTLEDFIKNVTKIKSGRAEVVGSTEARERAED